MMSQGTVLTVKTALLAAGLSSGTPILSPGQLAGVALGALVSGASLLVISAPRAAGRLSRTARPGKHRGPRSRSGPGAVARSTARRAVLVPRAARVLSAVPRQSEPARAPGSLPPRHQRRTGRPGRMMGRRSVTFRLPSA
jgi:hypothetical protein